MPIDEIPLPINLQTPKDILRIRDPPKVRRMPQIVDVNVTSSSRASHPTLRRGSACAIATRAASSTVAGTTATGAAAPTWALMW